MNKENLRTLNEVGFVGRGRSRHRPRNDKSLYGGKYPFVQTGDVRKADFYLTEYSQTYNEKGLAQSKIWAKGTLCITIAANIAETAILGIDACFPDSIIGFIPDEELADVRYIKYCLETYKLQMQAISLGATQDNLSLEKLFSIKFYFPPLPIQQHIASILSAYDELIEHNNQRIKVLEEMASQLYKEWFVRMRFPEYEHVKMVKGVPEGWEIAPLSNFVSTQYGFTASASEEQIGPRFLRITDITSNFINWDNVPYCSISRLDFNKYKLNEGDIVVARTGATAGYAKLIGQNPPKSVFASYLVRLIPNDFVNRYIIGQVVESSDYKKFILSVSTGSAQPQANAHLLTLLNIKIPDADLAIKFNLSIEPIFKQKTVLLRENLILRQTRDLLLPRLISGKLSLKEVEQALVNN